MRRLQNLQEKGLMIPLLLQCLMVATILLNIPAVRQITGFMYLLFLPGFLILKIFRASNDEVITNTVLSAGLSLVFLMFIGTLMNELYPFLGIASPLSSTQILLTVSVAIFMLWGIASLYGLTPQPALRSVLRLNTRAFAYNALPLISLSLLSVVGAHLVLESNTNALLLVMFVAIPLLVTLITLRRHSYEGIFPSSILAITLALLLHIALTSTYLIGFDVHAELNILDYTIANAQWDTTISYNYGAMLSITILPLIFSVFLDLSSLWILKIVSVLIFSLVPLTLFKVYKDQTTSRIAFLSVFLFIAYNQFYLGMPGLAKQMIGEIFFTLLILLIVDRRMSVYKRHILSLIFGAGLITSHYALAYIYLFFALIVFLFTRWRAVAERQQGTITGPFLLTFTALLLAWYAYTSQSEIVLSLFELVKDGVTRFYRDLGGGLEQVATPFNSPLHEVTVYVFVGLQIFIVLGVLSEFLRRQKSRFNRDYMHLSLLSVGVLVICLFLPDLGETLTIYRIYQIMLCFLAPFFIIGVLNMSTIVMNRGRNSLTITGTVGERGESRLLLPITALLITFFLLQSGFIYEVSGDPYPTSMPLSGYRANPLQHFSLYAPYTSQQELECAQYLMQHKTPESRVYADFGSIYYVLTSSSVIRPQDLGTRFLYVLENTWPGLPSGSYIYLRHVNLLGKMESSSWSQLWNLQDIAHLLEASVIIYSNNESILYQVK